MMSIAVFNAKPRWRFARALTATLVAAVTAATVVSGSALAQRAAIEKDFPLPPVIADMQKGGVADYESKKPGLGYGFQYGKKGWKSDIYIYDLGAKSIPDGPKNDVITSQLERAKQDIYTVAKTGAYTGVQLKSTFDVANAGGKPVFTCAAFAFTRKDIGAADSYVCLTGAAKKFVKVRITTAADANSKATAEKFLVELAGVLPLR